MAFLKLSIPVYDEDGTRRLLFVCLEKELPAAATLLPSLVTGRTFNLSSLELLSYEFLSSL